MVAFSLPPNVSEALAKEQAYLQRTLEGLGEAGMALAELSTRVLWFAAQLEARRLAGVDSEPERALVDSCLKDLRAAAQGEVRARIGGALEHALVRGGEIFGTVALALVRRVLLP